MSHTKALCLARTILTRCGAAAGLLLLAGCTAVSLTNLTSTSLPENPSEIYTFTLRATPHSHSVVKGSVAPHIVVDGQIYAMKPSSLGGDIYEFDYQLPPGRQDITYYYLVNYQLEGNGLTDQSETNTDLQHATVVHRYVLSLEASRGPVGAVVGVLGRGFTPQDVVQFNGVSVRTVYASPTSLSFYVPALPSGTYQVAVASPAGNSPVGGFRVDALAVTVDPTALTLIAGQTQNLTFTLGSPAPAGGLLLEVTTDVPESVIMPEVSVPAGQTSVTVPIQGGRPGNGSLVLKGYGEGLTIPVTVTAR
jgi:hypothetical protein